MSSCGTIPPEQERRRFGSRRSHDTGGEARPDEQKARQQHELLATLFRELFQTEHSAERHPRHEAERLGQGSPAEALRAVADHASSVLAELTALARANDLPFSRLGLAMGELFSRMRNVVADRLVEAERSYRVTLLGLRHGVDLVKLIRRVADASGQVEIGGFCTRWLEEREPLVERVELAMSWFATHPDRAAETAAPLFHRRRKDSDQEGERGSAAANPA